MAEITYIDGREQAIERAESLLRAAKDGRLTGLGFAVCFSDGSVGAGFYVSPNRAVLWTLLGGVDELHYNILHDGVSRDEDDPGD